MQIKQPTFPLTTAAFAAALRTGHGRALQQVSSYGPNGFEDEITKACVSCLSYDPQCEAQRTPWLISIVDRAKLNEKVLQALEVMADASLQENHRDMSHRSAILKELAGAGSEHARSLLYRSLARVPHTSDVIGVDQILALDGMDGLIHVARQLGQWLRTDPDFWVDDYPSEQFDSLTGIEGGLAALEREAAVDSDIANYLAGVRKTREGRSASSGRFDTTAYTGAEIVAHLSKNPGDQCHWFRRWGAKAASDHLDTVFAALLASEEPEHVKRLLGCFAKKGVPRFDSRLLPWIAHPDEQIRWAAVRAVAPLTHGELRQAAMRLLAAGDLANGVTLLVNNFEASDFAMCAEYLEPLHDADQAHRLVGELLDLCEAHADADASDCLLYVYELSPCSICRKRALKALIDTNAAPAWVLTEAAHDADPGTRAIVAA
jgi:hypothetical protein